MPRARRSDVHAGEIELEYECFGTPGDPTLLCLPGLGNQLLLFPEEFCEALVGRGFRVVRMDNRDAGRSSTTDPGVEYTLSDMAADAVAVLDRVLALDPGASDPGGEEDHRAVVFGVSLGGMIAQTMAIEHPTRVRALVSVMSTTGEPDVGAPSAAALAALTRPSAPTIAEQIDQDLDARRLWSNPEWFDAEQMRDYFAACYERAWVPGGSERQFAAVVRSGDRAAGLASLTVPALVVHGAEDTLIDPSGGQRTAELIPDAELLVIDGMSHDFVYQAWPPIIEAVTALTARTFGSDG